MVVSPYLNSIGVVDSKAPVAVFILCADNSKSFVICVLYKINYSSVGGLPILAVKVFK
jgi:hypothetical protein